MTNAIEKDAHTVARETDEREVFDYLVERCERLEQFGIRIYAESANKFSITFTDHKPSRIKALQRAEWIAHNLGFE